MALSGRWFFLLAVALAVFASGFFLPGLYGGFVFDDGSNIVNNEGIRLESLDAESIQQVVFGVQPGGTVRVLPTISFALDYWRGGGLDPATFKSSNLLIHALTTVALAYFLRWVLLLAAWPSRKAAAAALILSVIWAMHPLQVSSVLYVVQRMQTMGTLFLVLALICYVRGRWQQVCAASGTSSLLLAILFWIMAMGCKEDSVLFPLYAFVLELTILQFRAADSALARAWRKLYLYSAVAGVALFLFVVVPHYWSWDKYPFRDFSTYERLLTQGRVLVMYIGQILVPMPKYMPFYYDWLQPSRGLWQPWSTLPALLIVGVLLIAALRLRQRMPVFAAGVLIYFSSQFVSSNVIGLELAFEHRNNFALIGAVLAIAGLFDSLAGRLKLKRTSVAVVCGLVMVSLGYGTLVRSEIWSSPIKLAQKSAEFAPGSSRAWNSLCVGYFELGGGYVAANPYLDRAIDACSRGAASNSYSVTSLTNLVVFKTMRGDVSANDWARFLERFQSVAMSPENSLAVWVIINNANRGVALDQDGLTKTIRIAEQRLRFRPVENAAIGYFLLGRNGQSDDAFRFLSAAMAGGPQDGSLAREIIADMKQQGRDEWASSLEAQADRNRQLLGTEGP